MKKQVSFTFTRADIEAMMLKQIGLKMPENWLANADNEDSVTFSWEEAYIPYVFSLDATLPNNVMDTLRAFCQSQEWIKAIKETRTVTGWGLKEAKDYVEYQFRDLKAKREW